MASLIDRPDQSHLIIRPPLTALASIMGFLTGLAIVIFGTDAVSIRHTDRHAPVWLVFGVAVLVGLCIRYVAGRVLHGRIELDSASNRLIVGRKALASLDEIQAVELDTTPRVAVMNSMSFLLATGKRIPIVDYDVRSNQIDALAAEIAAFLNKPIQLRKDYDLIKRRKN